MAISDSVPSIASNAVRTDSTAALIASEGFGESTGNLNGASSGSGWSGSWSAVTGWNIVSGNLTPATIPNGQVGAGDTVTLPNSTGGNHVTIPYTGSSNATRTLSTTVGTTRCV